MSMLTIMNNGHDFSRPPWTRSSCSPLVAHGTGRARPSQGSKGPIQYAPPNDRMMEQMPPRSLSILIADDNQDSADSLAILLQANGHDVTVVYNGLDAV